MAKHVAIIGGGVAGTSAARKLREYGYQVTIFEKDSRLGGRVHSISGGNTTFELGAGFVTSAYSNTFQLLKELGLSQRLQVRKSCGAIARKGVVYSVTPTELLLHGNPIGWGAQRQLVASGLGVLSRWLTYDIHKPWPAQSSKGKSLKDAFLGQDGEELIDYFFQPILDGYCYWNANRISVAIIPFLYKLLAGRTSTLSGGLQQIPELATNGCEVLLSHSVQKVERHADDGFQITASHDDSEKIISVNGVVCATTASVVPRIITDLSPQQRDFFSAVGYSTTAVLAQTFRRIGGQPNSATAFARQDKESLAAITISSDQTATLVKIFASGAEQRTVRDKNDDELRMWLLSAAKLGSKFNTPTFEYLQRWPEAIPEFTPDHIDRIQRFMKGAVESADVSLVFAGDYLAGPFIEGALTSGQNAAERLHQRLK